MPRMRPEPGISSSLVSCDGVSESSEAVTADALQTDFVRIAAVRARIEASTMAGTRTIRSGVADCRRRCARAGYEAYLAGGCVRDLLLGREPADYDVATSATPDVVLEMFPRTFAVGAHFGVVLVAPESGRRGFCD